MNTDEVKRVAEEVAINIAGASCTASEYRSESYVLTLAGDLFSVFIGPCNKADRLAVGPHWDRLSDYVQRGEHIGITVNAKRDPGTLANDINHRVIAPARELQAKLLERQGVKEAYKQATMDVAQSLHLAGMSEPRYSDKGKGAECYDTDGEFDCRYIKAEVAGDKVTIVLDDLTLSQTLGVLGIVRKVGS